MTTPPGTHHRLADGSLFLHRSGTGGPPVVFLPGGGMLGRYYWRAHDQAARFATAVSYDRLGTGWSTPADLPRTGTQVTDDLHQLLSAAAIPPPYRLVGHSLGGLYARLYARRFPAEVTGLVLLDPTHEGILDFLPPDRARLLLNPGVEDPVPADRLDALRTAYRSAFAEALADWPADIRDPLLDRNFSRAGYRQSVREPLNLAAIFAEIRAAAPAPDIPQIILSAMGPDTIAEGLIPAGARAALAESANRKHRLYTHLAATRPRTELRRLDDTGHSAIPWLRPDAITRALRSL